MNIFDGVDIDDLGISMTDPTSLFSPETTHSLTTYEPPEELDTPPAYLSRTLTPWPSGLPRELAMGGESPEAIMERCGVKEEDYIKWAAMPAFRRALSDAAKEVREQGASFKILCQGIALDFLPVLDQQLHNDRVPLALKIDALKKIVEWSGLAPKEEKVQQGMTNQVQICINL